MTTQMPASAYQHVVVVMSIVLGLAVTQLLKGVAQLYRTTSPRSLFPIPPSR